MFNFYVISKLHRRNLISNETIECVIDKALGHEDMSLKYSALQHPNVTSAHIDKALNNEYWGVREMTIRHPNATLDQIDKALGDEDWFVVSMAMKIKKERNLKIT